MFSEMLRELDRNTVKYMVDDMREKIEKQEAEITVLQGTVEEQQSVLAKKDTVIAGKDAALAEKDAEIKRLREMLRDKTKA